MNIIEMALREKNMIFLQPKDKTMSLSCSMPKIIKFNQNKTSLDIYKTIKLIIFKGMENTFNSKDIIATFQLSYQFRINLMDNEEFNEKEFNQQVYPIYFDKINNMITEFGLPPISLSTFINIVKHNSYKNE